MSESAFALGPLISWALFGARITQSTIHLVSTSPTAVTLRCTAFAIQMLIGLYLSWRLFT